MGSDTDIWKKAGQLMEENTCFDDVKAVPARNSIQASKAQDSISDDVGVENVTLIVIVSMMVSTFAIELPICRDD